MNLLIAVDMEGITGVCDWSHVAPAHAEYQRFRRLMTADVNAAIRGALRAGATEVTVADGHNAGLNLLIEELDPHARLNAGSPSPLSMVQGAPEASAALFVGYHARVGTPNATLDHTWSRESIGNVWINDRVIGEFGLNAAVLGAFNAPVLMVSGDTAIAAEAAEWIPGIEAAVVKVATGHQSANLLPVAVAQKAIEEAAYRAVGRHLAGQGPAPLRVETPVRLMVEFKTSKMADMAERLPGALRLDGRRVTCAAPDMPAAYTAFRALANLAG